MMMITTNCFYCMVDRRKVFSLQLELLPEILTISNLCHTASRFILLLLKLFIKERKKETVLNSKLQ